MKIDLHYGKGVINLQVPRKNVSQIIQPWSGKDGSDNATVLSQSLQCSQKDNFQKKIAGKQLCVLTADGTRDILLSEILEQLLAVLRPASLIRFIISTGTHNTETAENSIIKQQIEKAASKAQIKNLEIHVHHCQTDDFINAGRTSRGTEVIFNAKAQDAQIFLVLSDIKCHYFAGYSNPIKNFVPGICTYRTAEQNHSLALDVNSTFGLHPWHNDKSRTNNLLAQDQLEAMQLIIKDRPLYALTTISSSGKIQWAKFDLAEHACGEAFDLVDKMNTHTVKTVDNLIVSPGGLPNDIDLYIAQRALELTKNAVKNDGEILFLAACPNGIGPERTTENFYNRLTAPVDEIINSIQTEYKLFTHKPYKFAQMIQRLRNIWIHSEMPDEIIKSIHLKPTHQPQQVVDNWLDENPNAAITIIDGANKLALYSKT